LRIVAALMIVIGLGVAWMIQPLTRPLTPDPKPAEFADPQRLRTHVRLLSVDFVPRDHTHPQNLDRVASYIRKQFYVAGATISEQVWQANGHAYRNVVAKYRNAAGPCRVVGAHYDAYGYLPGADDNASGVAGLLELARLLGRLPPLRCVELVAFSLEEPPFFRTEQMGSYVHAHSLRRREVDLMIALEMIGYFSDQPNTQRFPLSLMKWFYPSRGNFVTVVGRFGNGFTVRRVKAAMQGATRLPVFSINAPAIVPGIDFSDHLNYWAQGYDAVMVTDTAFLRNTNYHTPDDTMNRLNYQRMAQVVDAVLAFIRQ